jgi:TatD DNase family protein
VSLPAPGAFDDHTHLDIMGLPVAGVLAAAGEAGINRVITVGTDLASSRWSARCAEDYEPVYAAVAIHPNDTAAATASATLPDPAAPASATLPNPTGSASATLPNPTGSASDGLTMEAVLDEIEALAARPRVVAVGETGLDYYRDWSPPDVQREWFRAHIAIAKRTGKVLMIHDRQAHEDVLEILESEGPPDRVVFHCFSGDAAMARRCAEAGYVMSFAGNVTFASATSLREAAAAAPLDLILAETDAPFLTPVPHRGKPNSPAMTEYTIRFLAEVKGIDVATLCEHITATGTRLYRW